MPSWRNLAERNAQRPFSEPQRQWQLQRRGAYVCFNLLYDRGVRFGVQPAPMPVSPGLIMPHARYKRSLETFRSFVEEYWPSNRAVHLIDGQWCAFVVGTLLKQALCRLAHSNGRHLAWSSPLLMYKGFSALCLTNAVGPSPPSVQVWRATSRWLQETNRGVSRPDGQCHSRRWWHGRMQQSLMRALRRLLSLKCCASLGAGHHDQ